MLLLGSLTGMPWAGDTGAAPPPAQLHPWDITTGTSIGMEGRMDGGTSCSTQTGGIWVLRLSSHPNPAAELAAKGS